jgi:hypothetical protein
MAYTKADMGPRFMERGSFFRYNPVSIDERRRG